MGLYTLQITMKGKQGNLIVCSFLLYDIAFTLLLIQLSLVLLGQMQYKQHCLVFGCYSRVLREIHGLTTLS